MGPSFSFCLEAAKSFALVLPFSIVPRTRSFCHYASGPLGEHATDTDRFEGSDVPKEFCM